MMAKLACRWTTFCDLAMAVTWSVTWTCLCGGLSRAHQSADPTCASSSEGQHDHRQTRGDLAHSHRPFAGGPDAYGQHPTPSAACSSPIPAFPRAYFGICQYFFSYHRRSFCARPAWTNYVSLRASPSVGLARAVDRAAPHKSPRSQSCHQSAHPSYTAQP